MAAKVRTFVRGGRTKGIKLGDEAGLSRDYIIQSGIARPLGVSPLALDHSKEKKTGIHGFTAADRRGRVKVVRGRKNENDGGGGSLVFTAHPRKRVKTKSNGGIIAHITGGVLHVNKIDDDVSDELVNASALSPSPSAPSSSPTPTTSSSSSSSFPSRALPSAASVDCFFSREYQTDYKVAMDGSNAMSLIMASADGKRETSIQLLEHKTQQEIFVVLQMVRATNKHSTMNPHNTQKFPTTDLKTGVKLFWAAAAVRL